MRFKNALGIIGALLCVVGLSLIIPAACSFYYGETDVAISLLICLATFFGVGLSFHLILHNKEMEELTHREGVFTVGFGWLMVCLCGTLPYLLSGAITSVPDAMFESFSGFTTTGSTILAEIETMPKGILLWRCLTHWLGGIGIIVMFLAMLPFLGIRGMQVYRAEMPEFFGEKLTPRVKDTAKVLCIAYFIFTFLLFFLLVLGGIDKFNAICHTFSIVASGGFANHSSSVAQYQSPFLQWVMIIFMFLTGMNYAIHYQLLQGRFSVLFKDEELRFYFLYAAITTLIISICLMDTADYSGNALRNSAFHVVSIMSTTGLTTENYQAWPFLPQALLVTLMFIGGCGGSTSGGFKCMRVLLLLKCAYDEILMILHPRAVRHLKLGKISIPSDMLNSVCNYLIIFILITLLCTLLLSAFGLDLLTSFSAALSCISCVGPAFGLPGADGNYSSFPGAAKVTLSIVMLLGRIEIYALLVLVMPAFWRD